MKSKKLVFFGTEKFSTYSLDALFREGWNIDVVITKPDAPSGRGRKVRSPEVKEFAEKHSIQVFQPESRNDLITLANKLDTEIAVLSAYGKIIPGEMLDHFKLGIINIHPSLLPKHRGPSPIEQTIIDGDMVAGVSLMKLVEKMDAGPVYAQEKLQLKGDENAAELYEALGKLGAELLINNLRDIVDAKLQPVTQNDSCATYTKMIEKSDGIINWKESADIIDRKIRAHVLWPGSKTSFSDIPVTITEAHLGDSDGKPGKASVENNRLEVKCKTGSIIIDRLKPDGKREMASSEFLAGNQLLT